MAASRQDIKRWLIEGKEENQRFVIVVCDTFDYGDYPVYCKDVQEAKESYKKHNGVHMQRIMEIYDLEIPIDEQLKETKAWHIAW